MTSTPSSPEPISPEPPAKSRNTLGIIALVVAIIGAIFACIPGALIIGWILLPIGFILALVSLFQKGKRGPGIAALIISIVGTVVGVVVFLAVVADAFDDAFNEEPTVTTPDDGSDDAASSDEGPEEGTRENPYPLGSKISSEEWTVTVDSVDLDATDTVLAENEFNEAPADGHAYILARVTVTYTGTDPEGGTPWADIAYVSPEGQTFESYDAMVVAPEPFDEIATLYEGASTSGNLALEVPVEGIADGVLAIAPDTFGDKVFVSVQ